MKNSSLFLSRPILLLSNLGGNHMELSEIKAILESSETQNLKLQEVSLT